MSMEVLTFMYDINTTHPRLSKISRNPDYTGG